MMNEFSIVMNEHSESGDINSYFEKVINDLSNFNEKIELVTELQQNCSWVHQKYSYLADTASNIHLTHEERKSMNREELIKLSRLDVEDE